MVSLINFTPDPSRMIALSASLCYSKKEYFEILQDFKKIRYETPVKLPLEYDGLKMQKVHEISDKEINLLRILKNHDHMSVFEHTLFSFLISCSRSCSHQLVRHRIASFSQQSQRYVKSTKIDYVSPFESSDNNNKEKNKVLNDFENIALETYNKLISLGSKPEEARCVLPNATKTIIVMSMNARELIHFFTLRTCEHAQKEIRDIAWQMLCLGATAAPNIFENCGPKCTRNECKNPCGKGV